jgi:very-short-patch-repair endonuclease
MTDAERKLWSRMRAHQLGVHFRRQAPLGSYVLDFVCFAACVVVEVDGGQHADSEKDLVRDAWLRAQGFRVLRFWNNDVLQNIDGVLEMIMMELGKAPPPRPSPMKGEGENRLAPPAPSPLVGDDRLAPPAPSPLVGEGWGGGADQ